MTPVTLRTCWQAAVIVCATAFGTFAQTISPAHQSVAAAERAIAARPNQPDGYNELAIAFTRRARETSDPAYYDRAEAAIQESLRLAPDNFGARKGAGMGAARQTRVCRGACTCTDAQRAGPR